jgi:hypothetical protein
MNPNEDGMNSCFPKVKAVHDTPKPLIHMFDKNSINIEKYKQVFSLPNKEKCHSCYFPSLHNHNMHNK